MLLLWEKVDKNDGENMHIPFIEIHLKAVSGSAANHEIIQQDAAKFIYPGVQDS